MQFEETPWFPGVPRGRPEVPIHDPAIAQAADSAGAAPRGSAGPAPLGSADPAPLGSADPAPLGSANTAPLGYGGGGSGLGRGARAFDGPPEDESPFDADVEAIATSLGILRRLGGRRAAARSAALPMREYAVAEVVDLVASRGHSSAGEVAATLGLAQSRASVLVRRARDARWLDAEPGPWDARVTVVSVTDEGREIVELMQADRCTTVDRATVLWSDEDRAMLARLLGRFAEAVERPFRR